jgi:hypothetical protein
VHQSSSYEIFVAIHSFCFFQGHFATFVLPFNLFWTSKQSFHFFVGCVISVQKILRKSLIFNFHLQNQNQIKKDINCRNGPKVSKRWFYIFLKIKKIFLDLKKSKIIYFKLEKHESGSKIFLTM